jgi:hypothetical protein
VICNHCRWFSREHDSSLYGYCTRNPPTVAVIASQPVTLRPKVHETETCGDWTAAKETM